MYAKKVFVYKLQSPLTPALSDGAREFLFHLPSGERIKVRGGWLRLEAL